MLRSLHGAIERRLAGTEGYGSLFRSPGVGAGADAEVITRPIIGHDEIEDFARRVVDLSSEAVFALRARARRVADEIGRAAVHPAVVGAEAVGSVAMGSALRAIKAIDIAVYLRPEAAPESGTALRRWTAAILERADLAADVDASTGGLYLKPRSGGPPVELIPVLVDAHRPGCGRVYLRAAEEPLETSLRAHVQFFRRLNRSHGGHYGRMVRLVRWWAQAVGTDEKLRCDPLLAALMCARVAEDEAGMADYPWALARVFGLMARWRVQAGAEQQTPGESPGPVALLDPANPGNDIVSSYAESELTALSAAAEDALDAVTEAYYATSRRGALRFWRYLLGRSFGL